MNSRVLIFLSLVMISMAWPTIDPLRLHGAQDEVSEITFRIWTSRDGSQINGKFIAKIQDQVVVTEYQGQNTNLRYEDLVDLDQQYVDQVVKKFGSTPSTRTSWSDINGRNFRAFFRRLDGSDVEFQLIDEEKLIRIPTLLLSSQDIDHILSQLNRSIPPTQTAKRYRLWSYQDSFQNESRMIGSYLGLNQENVVLIQPDGPRSIPIAQLKLQDMEFIISIDNSTRIAIDPIKKAAKLGSATAQEKKDFSSGVPNLSLIWWFSLGLVFLLMMGLISIKYIYESGNKEFDDEL